VAHRSPRRRSARRRNVLDRAIRHDHHRDQRRHVAYTTDGSTPTSTTGTVYSSASVYPDDHLKAIAYKSGLTDSTVATATYTIGTTTVFEGESLSGRKLGPGLAHFRLTPTAAVGDRVLRCLAATNYVTLNLSAPPPRPITSRSGRQERRAKGAFRRRLVDVGP